MTAMEPRGQQEGEERRRKDEWEERRVKEDSSSLAAAPSHNTNDIYVSQNQRGMGINKRVSSGGYISRPLRTCERCIFAFFPLSINPWPAVTSGDSESAQYEHQSDPLRQLFPPFHPDNPINLLHKLYYFVQTP